MFLRVRLLNPLSTNFYYALGLLISNSLTLVALVDELSKSMCKFEPHNFNDNNIEFQIIIISQQNKQLKFKLKSLLQQDNRHKQNKTNRNTYKNMNKSQTSSDIIKFLQKYKITYIDPHTSIIEYNNSGDGDQNNIFEDWGFGSAYQSSTWVKNKMKQSQGKMIQCYLVKDMVVQASNTDDSVYSNVIETLNMHQNLNNKYILTLVHHQISTKTVDYVQQQQSIHEHDHDHQQQSRASKLQRQNNTRIDQYCDESFNQQYNMSIQQSHLLQSQCQSRSHSRSNSNSHYKNSISNNNYNNYNHSRSQSSQKYHGNNNNNSVIKNQSIKEEQDSKVVQQEQVPETITQISIRAIYQYGKLTLKEQIGHRIASKTKFQEEELWAILATVVQALSYLQYQEIVYGVLGTDKIFINNSLVRILDPSATATDPFLIAQGRLYSPQILNDQQNIDLFKSDVYITALILLQCGLLVDLSVQPQPSLHKYLNQFKSIYSRQLCNLLQLCLAPQPQSRPSFQQLKQHLSKQLDMNDFSSAYDDKNKLILQPLSIDKQDQINQSVQHIQVEELNQQLNYDVLYQSIAADHDQSLQANARRIKTEHQRAKQRYLGIVNNNNRQIHEQRQSMTHNDRNQIKDSHLHRTHLNQQRHASTSPIQTRRNSRNANMSENEGQQNMKYFPKNGKKVKKLPSLNMAISQSVYPDNNNVVPLSVSSGFVSDIDKTNRKTNPNFVPNAEYYPSNGNITYGQGQKQNINMVQYQQNGMQNIRQKIKKTKLIKDKLVKLQQQSHPYHSSNPNSNRQTALKQQKQLPNPNIYPSNTNNNNSNKFSRCAGQSIRQQLDQQSDSSYLYYDYDINNNNNSSINRNKHQQSVGNNSKNSSDGSGKSSNRYLNYQHYQNQYQYQQEVNNHNNHNNNNYRQNVVIGKNRKIATHNNSDQIFTDPNLLQTIKEDLARISSSKNLKLAGSGLKEKNRLLNI